ncbi:hypothetical protein ACTXT7_006122 [Hymenolepis weldensis]
MPTITVHAITPLVQAAIDDMKLYPSVRAGVKVTNLWNLPWLKLIQGDLSPSLPVSKVVAQNAGEAALPYQQDLLCSQTNVLWFQIEQNLAGPIRGTSCLILVDSYSNSPEVIYIRSDTTGIVINSLRRVFANPGISKIIVSTSINQFFSTRYRTTPHVGVQIWVRHRKYLRFQYATEPKTDATKTHLDTWDLPSPENSETPEIQRNYRPDCYSGLFRRP